MINRYDPRAIFAKHGIDYDALEDVTEEVLDPQYYDGMFSDSECNENFKEMVARFTKMKPIPPLDFRRVAIKVISDAYIDQTGEVPNGVQLNLLGNWILAEDITDPHPDKVTNTEFPVMNKRQLRLRHNREVAIEKIDNMAFPKIPRKKFTSERFYD